MPWVLPDRRQSNPPTLCRRCIHCSSVLERSAYLDVCVHVMDRALTRHSRGLCTPLALADEAMAKLCNADSECETEVLWPDGEPALVFAARAGRLDRALRLLHDGHAERCGGVDATGRAECTALHHAAAHNGAALVTELLKAGARTISTTQDDVVRQEPGGRTPLHAAAAASAGEAASLLVAADPQSACLVDWEGRLPAELAWLAGAHALALDLADAALATARAASSMAEGEASPGAVLSLTELESRLGEVRAREVASSDRQRARTLRRVQLRERRKHGLDVSDRPALQIAHLCRAMWSEERCELWQP